MFQGEKVRLRSLELTDLDEIMKHWNDLNLRKFLGPVIPHSREEREEWIRSTWEDRKAGRGYTFAIEDRKTKEFLGTCSLTSVRPINRSAKVGIAIHAEKNRGKGYGTDAMNVLLKFGFDYLNLHRIGLSVFASNPQAIRVYEKVGFKQVGKARETDFIDGVYHDDVIMDILEDEWRELKKGIETQPV